MEPLNRLGLPENGPGSLAGLGRRITAFSLDYFASMAVAHLIGGNIDPLGNSFRILTLEVMFAQMVFLTALTGSSFGQRLFGVCPNGVTHSPNWLVIWTTIIRYAS
ncbi:MAG: hypothetical protein NTW81_06580 [Actinobacteria bacterium]|nr:hypothetical protein [Actinomycetota bacterium]